jgi:hypothetical protein
LALELHGDMLIILGAFFLTVLCICFAAVPEAGTWETYTVTSATQNPGKQQGQQQQQQTSTILTPSQSGTAE